MLTYIRMALGVGAVLLIVAAYGWGYHKGKQSVYAWLEQEKVRIVKDGKDIDTKVMGADDSALCGYLGFDNCMSDEASGP